MEINRLVVSKLTQEIWQILTWTLKSLKHFCFNGLVLSKVFIFWAKNVQRLYLLWHWRVVQNLKKNCPVVRKMTWEIWQIFTRALESVKSRTLMGFFCTKYKRCYLKIFLRSYVSWKWILIQSLKRNWLVVLKLTWGSSRILTRALKSLKIFCFNGLLASQKNWWDSTVN